MPYIKKLTLYGFKSFAKPTNIIFDKGLNVVVGPNGAGKSNLADAICFVLGRLKVRSMRATKAANLIYNGGKTHKPAQNASVSMIFDNSDGVFALPTPASEVEIRRIVKKDGTSTYKINGDTRTRQEMLELLAQAGIDPEGFNIILQAEISTIMQMHPEEKRQIIDDVAGISIYESRKEKSLRELEKTEDKLKEVKTILNERAAYMRNLEQEKEQAEKYEKLKRAVRRDKAALVFKQVKEKEQEKGKVDGKVKDKKEQLGKVQNKINSIQGSVASLDKQIQDINEHIERKSGVEQEALYGEISDLRSGAAVLDVKVENYKEQINAIGRRIEQLKIDEVRLGQELKYLEQEKSRKVVKGLDPASFRLEVVKAAKKMKDTSSKLGDIFSELFGAVKERKNSIDNFIKQKKIKQAHEEINAFVYSLEEILTQLNKIFKETSEIAEKISKLKIGKEEGRNIALEIGLAKKELDRIQDIVKKSSLEKKDFENLLEDLSGQHEKKKKTVFDKEKLEKKIRANFEKLLLRKSKLQGELKKQEFKLKEEESRAREIENEINTLNIIKARADAELEVISGEIGDYKELREDLEKASLGSRAEIEIRIRRNENALEQIGSVNLRALEVYDRVKEEYDNIAQKVEKVGQEKGEIIKIIEEVDKKKKRAFMQAFNAINESFSHNFMALSDKGRAFLELENKQDPFGGGLDIIIKLAKGKYMDGNSLSGGEKVIVALALIFAIQKYKPYCFYIFDEIDPALDKRNSEKLATILRNNVQKSQCIIISHNDAVINQADTLYGASMQDGISKVIGLRV